jgi:zinc transport system substrate-binding protein
MRPSETLSSKLNCFSGCWTRVVQLVLLVGALSLGLGCQSEGPSSERAKPSIDARQAEGSRPLVFVSNSFLREAVNAIAGTRVELLYLLPPNLDPTTWKPTTEDLEKMQRARLLVLNGAEFEPWVAGVALPSSRMLRTANAFMDQWIKTEAVVHSHGPGGEHSHAGVASTTWLDFELAKLQANSIRERLEQLVPEAADDFKKGCEEFNAQLSELDQQMRLLAIKLGTRPLLVSHPFHEYWAKRYGLNLRAVHWDPTNAPGAEGTDELQRALKDFPAELFLWESKPSEVNVELLREKGIKSVVFGPAANLGENESWLEAMRRNMRGLEQAIE